MNDIPPLTDLTAEDEGNLRELVTSERFASVWTLANNHLYTIAADGLHQRDPSAKDRYDTLSRFLNSLRSYLPPDGDDATGAAE